MPRRVRGSAQPLGITRVHPRVINLALDYLDSCRMQGREATLVGMHWYIDSRNKTMPILDEVNEALARRRELRVSCRNGAVVFSA